VFEHTVLKSLIDRKIEPHIGNHANHTWQPTFPQGNETLLQSTEPTSASLLLAKSIFSHKEAVPKGGLDDIHDIHLSPLGPSHDLVNALFCIHLMSTFHLTLLVHPSARVLVCLSIDGRWLASLMMTEVACTMPLYRLLPCMLCTVNLPRTMSRGYVALMPTDT